MKKKRIIYMGTPQFSAVILEALITAGYNIVAVVTQQDKKVGRKQIIEFSKVKEIALKYAIPVIQPFKIKDDFNEILSYDPECIITCAYGQIVPKAVLDYPKHKCINIHASLLPKYRGGAPIHYAIWNGDQETGISIMEMVEKMDAGDVCFVKKHPINPNIVTTELFEELSFVGRDAILECIDSILSDSIVFEKQNEAEVTYAYTIKKSQEQLDLTQSVINVYNHIRALSDVPGAYTILNNKKVKLFDAQYELKQHQSFGKICFEDNKFAFYLSDGILYVSTLQVEGKVKMKASDFYNGFGKQLVSFEIK